VSIAGHLSSFGASPSPATASSGFRDACKDAATCHGGRRHLPNSHHVANIRGLGLQWISCQGETKRLHHECLHSRRVEGILEIGAGVVANARRLQDLEQAGASLQSLEFHWLSCCSRLPLVLHAVERQQEELAVAAGDQLAEHGAQSLWVPELPVDVDDREELGVVAGQRQAKALDTPRKIQVTFVLERVVVVEDHTSAHAFRHLGVASMPNEDSLSWC